MSRHLADVGEVMSRIGPTAQVGYVQGTFWRLLMVLISCTH